MTEIRDRTSANKTQATEGKHRNPEYVKPFLCAIVKPISPLRVLITSLCALLLVLSPFVEAQEAKKIPRIGYLATNASFTEAFLQGLRDIGYFEGKNITVEFRTTEGRPDRYPDLIAELVGLKVISLCGGELWYPCC